MIYEDYLAGDTRVSFVKEEMLRYFKSEIELIKEDIDLNHHGWFLVDYHYMPKDYTVRFEGEFHYFNVRIMRNDGGFIDLKQLADYDNALRKKAVREAAGKLKDVLQDDISFYKVINGRRCREVGGEYIRVK